MPRLQDRGFFVLMANFDTYDSTYNQGVQTGQNAISSFDPTSTANSQKNTFNNVYGSQSGTISDLTNAYAGQIANNPSVTSLYQQGNDMFNVPNLQKQATYLNNQVTNTAPRAYSLARGFDYSEPQVENKINTDLRFLQPQATAATANANTASSLANQFVQSGITQNQMNLLPIQSQISLQNDAMARMSSGYTVAAQNEMEGLIQKLNAGISLSSQEIARANQLAQLAEDYQKQQTINQTTLANTIQGQKYQNIAPGNNLVNTVAQAFINPSTGKVGRY